MEQRLPDLLPTLPTGCFCGGVRSHGPNSMWGVVRRRGRGSRSNHADCQHGLGCQKGGRERKGHPAAGRGSPIPSSTSHAARTERTVSAGAIHVRARLACVTLPAGFPLNYPAPSALHSCSRANVDLDQSHVQTEGGTWSPNVLIFRPADVHPRLPNAWPGTLGDYVVICQWSMTHPR